MSPDLGFDVDRYRKLLAEATDEKKRLALIELLVEERAKERLVPFHRDYDGLFSAKSEALPEEPEVGCFGQLRAPV